MNNESLIHCCANCVVCEKVWEDYRTAKAQARAHARKTGHHVIVETGYFVEYNNPKKENRK